MLGDIWPLIRKTSTDTWSEATPGLDPRAERIRATVDWGALALLREAILDHVAGRAPLTALRVHYKLEKSTPLLLLHLILRKGRRNRHDNGLQQTYGDHTRLLLLGIDMLDGRDTGWYLTRLAAAEGLGEADIDAAIARYHAFPMSAMDRVVLWLAASMHDYGKLYWRGEGLDADDALHLCQPILDEIVDPGTHGVLAFCIRNHDYIEHVLNGQVPVPFITRQRDELPADARGFALRCLGIIQLAGAASLGEGRLTRKKMGIYLALMDGSLVEDASPACRLARLLSGERLVVEEPARERARDLLAGLDESERRTVDDFLGHATLIGWPRVREELLAAEAEEDAVRTAWEAIRQAAATWEHAGADCQHVVLESGATGPWTRRGRNEPDPLDAQRVRLLNGCEALML